MIRQHPRYSIKCVRKRVPTGLHLSHFLANYNRAMAGQFTATLSSRQQQVRRRGQHHEKCRSERITMFDLHQSPPGARLPPGEYRQIAHGDQSLAQPFAKSPGKNRAVRLA
jgi:hypothetical protein